MNDDEAIVRLTTLSISKRNRILVIAVRALSTIQNDYDENELDNALQLYIEADSALEQIANIIQESDEG